MTEESPPPDVLSALETLENASTPAELGPPYQVLLDWQRRNALVSIARKWPTGLIALGIVAVALLGVSFTSFITPENAQFWRGAQFGMMVSWIAYWIGYWISPPPEPPPTIARRIEDALNRWRHLTPRMREIPQ
ncbi:hypothetical protein [Terricaulis sp.]|uniref:hypothetical protein n=1 Tax=Terricaulis sp. TaxID=2768686 RepID=UPI0037851984